LEAFIYVQDETLFWAQELAVAIQFSDEITS